MRRLCLEKLPEEFIIFDNVNVWINFKEKTNSRQLIMQKCKQMDDVLCSQRLKINQTNQKLIQPENIWGRRHSTVG